MSFQTPKSLGVLDENREACDCPIDCKVNYTVNAQKSMKSRDAPIDIGR